MRILDRLRGGTETRDTYPYSLGQLASDLVNFNGVTYPLFGGQTMRGGREEVEGSFAGLVSGAMKANAVVFACMVARLAVFSSARFQFQQFSGGQPGELFSSAALTPLENPWPGGTQQDLLARLITDADLAGNAFVNLTPSVDGPPGLRRLRPDWVTIVADSPSGDPDGLDVTVKAYLYRPGGRRDKPPILLFPEEMAHFAPYPDPIARFRGMSWLTPIITEIEGDRGASRFREKWFSNGATPNLMVNVPNGVGPDKLNELKTILRERHEGVENAGRTLLLLGGADAKVVGANMQQMDFKAVQGAGETRICMAAGVHPVVVGASESLEGASLNAGNFTQARRNMADKTLDHLWKNVAGSMSHLIDKPNVGAKLVIDTRYVPFLREDQKDEAEIVKLQAEAISTLVTAGFDPASAKQAVTAADLSQVKHTGLVSVQLLKPGDPAATPALGAPKAPEALPAASNGNGSSKATP